ncbi:hypothetical protein ACFXGT_18460 [Streptomyces sp. NPDC059352]|uniref:hypothetical protein n=1 Tax=Streptomyces sp. NPDC059352 TaxID=3346810 RepID=UPI0036B3420D
MVRTRLKMAATLTVVVLALTGFHTGHGSSSSGGGSGKSRSGGGDSDSDGGGCSSSKKSNDDYDGSAGSSGGSGGSGEEYTYDPTPTSSPTAAIRAQVVDCVEPAQAKRKGRPARKADTTATVKIVSEAYAAKTVRVVVRFLGADRTEVDRAETVIEVGYRETKTFELAMESPKAVGRVKDCEVWEVSEVSSTATPTATPTGTPSATSS